MQTFLHKSESSSPIIPKTFVKMKNWERSEMWKWKVNGIETRWKQVGKGEKVNRRQAPLTQNLCYKGDKALNIMLSFLIYFKQNTQMCFQAADGIPLIESALCLTMASASSVACTTCIQSPAHVHPSPNAVVSLELTICKTLEILSDKEPDWAMCPAFALGLTPTVCHSCGGLTNYRWSQIFVINHNACSLAMDNTPSKVLGLGSESPGVGSRSPLILNRISS